MAIVNKLTSIFPGFGNATEYLTLTAQNLPINATTTFTLNTFVNYVRSGRIRIKNTATGGAGAGVSGLQITGTDGTTTVVLHFDTNAFPTNSFFDRVFDFMSELNLNSISLLVTTVNGGGAGTIDIEIAGNP